MVPRLVATSATIIPCGGNAPTNPLSIPSIKSSPQQPEEGMSLIVQLGTTSVGYTPTLTTAVVSSSNTSGRAVPLRAQVATAGQQPPSVAKHRLPMQIKREPQQQVNRSLQHAALPARNIAALARPINNHATPPVSQSAPSPTIAGRVLASPVKDSTLDDDLLEGVVEKRPKYHKHLPLNYQYVLQDHNYGAPPPPTPNSPPKPLVNGVPTTNGLTRSQPPISQQPPNNQHYAASTFATNRPPKSVQQTTASTTFGTTTMSNVFGIGTRVPVRGAAPAEESDVESTDGEREVDPQGEETETAPEGEDNEDDSVTRCICDFQHDDGYMICCDKCSVWQHVDCMGIDRANIPDEYLCEKCQPRRIDKQKAIALQMRKKKELLDTSDSSSDTSSSSDANVPLRKPNATANNRRPAQRKNSSSGGKQRRESAKDSTRQNNRQAFRKKQTEKRPPVRRKSSQPVVNNNPPAPEKSSPVEKKPTTPTTPVEQLRQWIDSYEEAVTNHYSPELRARIASIKVNGVHSDLKLPTNLMTTPKCRVSLLPSGVKILVACVSLSGNQPLLELRGKYMLCGGGTNRPPRPAVPPPGPYIFHYKLPRDNTEVCIDARTYGNDARFVRRSCKPNAEMRHCIEKGALHLYLVTTKAIDKNTEITLAVVPGLTCVLCGDSCASAAATPSPDNHKSLNGLISPNNNNNTQISDKRRRGRRRTVSENLSPPKAPSKPTPKPAPSKSQTTSKVSPTPKPTPKVVPSVRVPTPPPRVPTPPPPPEPEVEKAPKSPTPPPPPPAPPSPPPPAPTTRSAANNAARKPPTTTPKKKEDAAPKEESVKDTTAKQAKKEAADKKNKMTREERKMEAIMKAFERMEKDQARKQEAQARHRKESTDDSKSHSAETKESKEKDKSSDRDEANDKSSTRSTQRKRKFSTTKRKGRGRSQSTPQPVLRPRRTLRRSQPTRERSPDSAESSDESPVRQRQNRTPTPPPARRNTPPTTPTQNATGNAVADYAKSYESPPQHTSSSSGETPPTPMSKTAMLVAAAVGPLAPGFKFPKTKKGLINSWLKSPEGSPPALPDELPARGQQGYNAKKRWLRQAISEECDSPNSRPDVSNSPTEHVAPPKKRRMARESISEDHSVTPPTTPTHNAEALSQMTDEEDTVSSPQDNVKPAQESQDEVCGSSQESEGPDSPAPVHKPKTEAKNEEETEESEEEEGKSPGSVKKEEPSVKQELSENDKEDVKKEASVKCEVKVKEEKKPASGGSEDEGKKDKLAEQAAAAAATATKRKLSISEYRQRRQQGGGTGTGQGAAGKNGGGAGGPSSPTTSATSSLSSSSSEDEDEAQTPAVIAKSLMLEAALDTNLAKKPPATHLFNSAPTLVERQRENLTQRLKREFGLFLSDDEEQEKARKQANVDSLNKQEKEKDSKKKNLPPPPPPPADPPHYGPLYFPGVGHPMYTNRYPQAPAAPPPLVDPPFYNPGSSFYQH